MKSMTELKTQSTAIFAMMDRFDGAAQISEDAILCMAAAAGDLATDGIDYESESDVLLITGLKDGDIEILNVNQNNKYHLMQVIVAHDAGYCAHKAITTLNHDGTLAHIDAQVAFKDEQIALQAMEENANQESATGCECCGDVVDAEFDEVAAEKMRDFLDGRIDLYGECDNPVVGDIGLTKRHLKLDYSGTMDGMRSLADAQVASSVECHHADFGGFEPLTVSNKGVFVSERFPARKDYQRALDAHDAGLDGIDYDALLSASHDIQQHEFEESFMNIGDDGFDLHSDAIDLLDDIDDQISLDRYLDEQFALDTIDKMASSR